jgi:predicted dehydrogenase
MSSPLLRIGVAGCGAAARAHLPRLAALSGVEIVGLADTETASAHALLSELSLPESPPIFADHRELIARQSPHALAIFTPHRFHYRLAMDGLQAGCHLFIEKPLSTNPQEAQDIVNLARGRSLTVAVGHQFRLAPSLIEARERIRSGAIGRLRLASGLLAAPWLANHGGPENSWRFDPRLSGGGMLADAGDHLLDALLWLTGQPALEVAAYQDRVVAGLDLVTAVSARLVGGTLATIALAGIAPLPLFELTLVGESGILRATPESLQFQSSGREPESIPIPPQKSHIDQDFVQALQFARTPCCPADQALDTVRMLEAVSRSASTGQPVRLA